MVLLVEGVPAKIEDVWKMCVAFGGDVRRLLLSLQVFFFFFLLLFSRGNVYLSFFHLALVLFRST